MKVYLDLVFLVNFGINFTFLGIIQILFNEKFRIKRGILSSLIASFLLFMYFFDYYLFGFVKIFGGFLLIGIGVGLNKFLIKSSLFYLFEFGLTGIVQSFKVTGVYLLIAIIILLVLIMIQSFKKQSIFINHFKYNISVTLFAKDVKLKGFLDTGNMLHVLNIPVIFLDYKYYHKDLKVYSKTYVKTVNGINDLNCYKPHKFKINIDGVLMEKEVLIAFTHLEDDFECLLNYNLFI